MRRVHIRISDECYAELMRRAGEATAAEGERVSIGTIVERAVRGDTDFVVVVPPGVDMDAGCLGCGEALGDHPTRSCRLTFVATPDSENHVTEPKP